MDSWIKYRCNDCEREFPCIIVNFGGEELCEDEPEYCMMCGSDDIDEVGKVRV